MKAETCCCYVLAINYILCNRVVLDCKFVYFINERIHCWWTRTLSPLPSPSLSLCLSLSLNMHYQFAIVFSTLHVRNEPHSIKVGAQVDVRECILSALGCCFNCWTTDCCSLSCGMKLTAHFDGRKKRKSDGDNSRLFAANMSTTSGSLAI